MTQTNLLIPSSWKFEQLNKIIKANEDNKNMSKIICNECLIYWITEFLNSKLFVNIWSHRMNRNNINELNDLWKVFLFILCDQILTDNFEFENSVIQ